MGCAVDEVANVDEVVFDEEDAEEEEEEEEETVDWKSI